MLSGLSHYWSNNPGSRMAKSGYKSGKINQIGIADVIVRNDEVVGSIPTSSTNLNQLQPTSNDFLVTLVPLDHVI